LNQKKYLAERLDKIRKLIEEESIDALVISSTINRRYLSGFRGTAGVLLISAEKALLITDFRYVSQAEVQAPHFEVIRWQDDLYKSIAPLIEDNGWNKLGFEAGQVVYSALEEMKEKLPAEMVPVKETAEKLRIIKDVDEIAIMRIGAGVLDRAFTMISKMAKPGITERELALELEMFLLKEGAEEKSFRFIVASGQRGALPHGMATEKELQDGEMVTIDFGGIFDGYATDMTRTIALGKISEQQKQIYDIVYKAQHEAAAAVKPGLPVNEVDAVARNIIKDAGYGEYFGHGLGHGVGLEVHEQPTLNHLKTTELEPGMVVTIEPGIYIPSQGGVRIEDMVVVTKTGGESLTKSPRELINL